jgi:hypothetical protein
MLISVYQVTIYVTQLSYKILHHSTMNIDFFIPMLHLLSQLLEESFQINFSFPRKPSC